VCPVIAYRFPYIAFSPDHNKFTTKVNLPQDWQASAIMLKGKTIEIQQKTIAS
jgi:hypothetical protein